MNSGYHLEEKGIKEIINLRASLNLGFKQSLAHSEYFWFIFFSLSHYCSSYPIVRIRNHLGKETIGLQFVTRSMPCLTELHYLFYPNGVKIVPYNIYELLTPIALAHMIMGDFSKTTWFSYLYWFLYSSRCSTFD